MPPQNNRKIVLAKNAAFLYVLTFSTQLLSLITVPYLTRVLGPVAYGRLGVALSLIAYAQLVLDFGFILSATELVSCNSNDSRDLSKIVVAVTSIKAALGICFGIGLFLLCGLVESFKQDANLYILFYFAYLINSFLPDYLYRGKEQMKQITIRTVGVKILFTALMLLAIKSENDLILYPTFLLIGNLIAVLWSYIDIHRKYEITFVAVKKEEVLTIAKKTLPFFASRIASTFYQAANTLIIGILYPGQSIVGYYSSADKMMSMVKSTASPLADSLYPYMMRNKDFKLIKRIMLVLMPIILVGALIGFVYAEPISVLLFGKDYAGAKNILRCLIPAMIVILPTYIICFPVLVPLGLSKYANMSNIIGAILQVAFLVILFLSRNLNVYTICISSSMSEVLVFLFRLSVAYKNRYRISNL